jgi:hypothetical protein
MAYVQQSVRYKMCVEIQTQDSAAFLARICAACFILTHRSAPSD